MRAFVFSMALCAAASLASAAVSVTVNPNSTSVISISGVTGTGTQADPIVINENWFGGSLESTITISGAANEANLGINPAEAAFAWGIFVQKRVTNNSGVNWTYYDNELQEILGVPSLDGDGLSFAQDDLTVRPFSSNLLPTIVEEIDLRDFLNFSGGIVLPGQTLIMNFVITDNTPTNEFFLRQRPNFVAPTPGAATALLLGAGIVARRRRR